MPVVPYANTSKHVHSVYSGTTNVSGEFSVVYPHEFSSIPAILPIQIPTTSSNRTIRIVSSTTKGFTVKIEQRNSVNLLGIDVLLSATVAVSGANVSVVVLD